MDEWSRTESFSSFHTELKIKTFSLLVVGTAQKDEL
jgi:hypothetical protein